MNPIEVHPRSDQSGVAMVREYAGIAWRNRWLIAGCVVLFVGLAWLYCVLAPNYYRSETLILAEEPKLLENVVQGAGEGNLEQRIFVIQKEILNPQFLAPIAKEFNLYPKEMANN